MNFIKIKLPSIIVILFTILSLSSYGQTQMEMNIEAGAQFKKADKELNVIYQTILKEYASKPVFIKKFKVAQRLWVQLRDADLAAKFPGPDYYGTVEPMCRARYLADLTKQRIKFLKVWLVGITEGDACNGSVKTRQ